jgi:MFS family permease
MLFGCIFAVVGGWIADRYGAKIVFIVAGLFAFAGMALSIQATEFWHLLVSYSLLVAVGIGPTYVVATSMITRWFREARGLALAIVTSEVGMGSILMAPLSVYLLENHGWRFSFFIVGIIALIIVIPCALFLRKAPSATITSSSHDVSDFGSTEQSKETKEFSLVQALSSRIFLDYLLYLVTIFLLFVYHNDTNGTVFNRFGHRSDTGGIDT